MPSFLSDIGLFEHDLNIEYKFINLAEDIEVQAVTGPDGETVDWNPDLWNPVIDACWLDAKELEAVYQEQNFGL